MDKKSLTYRFGTIDYNLGSRTHVMGIVNVTPDSFSDGGKYFHRDLAVAHAFQLVEEGADFLDIGGESTRPGSDPVDLEEELYRVIPVIEQIAKRCSIPLSVDTYKASVAEAALQAGAVIVNDISALTFDSAMASVVARYHASVILMHINGAPKTMQINPVYKNVTKEVVAFLHQQAAVAESAGIRQIMVDPGFGFGKTFEHNLQLIRELSSLQELGYPVLAALSRKAMIGQILNLPPEERMEGTAAATVMTILHGAQIIRVHDVKAMKRVALVTDALK
jgi:dihydropteroate synthase